MRVSDKIMKTAVAVLAVLLFVVSANAELTGWWRFDNAGNIGQDSSEYGNDGTIVGNCSFSTDAVSGAGALEFTGGYIQLYSCSINDYEGDFSDGAASLAMWIKLDSANPSPSYNGFANIGAWCYPSYYPSSGNALSLKLFLSEGDSIVVDLPANTVFSMWHHFVVTVDAMDTSSGYKVYFDGSLIGEFPMDGSFGNFLPPQRPSLGAAYDVQSNTWSCTLGIIDDVRIYNSILTSQQIQMLIYNPDLNGDKSVDFTDLEMMTGSWLGQCSSPDWCGGADINRDSYINFADFTILAEQWMQTMP
ncbi:MAG: LamG-like jellyroll fold domain-containing protein [Phycisphaerae bacterium]|jgi:hypothetical protein